MPRASKLSLFLYESNAIEDVWDELSLIQAKKAWSYLRSKDRLTPKHIFAVHRLLMKYHLDDHEKGCWRTQPVYIGGHEAIDHRLINQSMFMWIDTVNNYLKAETEPEFLMEAAKRLHVLYEKVHPFIDGNGRTGRIFYNWMLIKKDLPIVVFKESEKHEYYKWFAEEKPSKQKRENSVTRFDDLIDKLFTARNSKMGN